MLVIVQAVLIYIFWHLSYRVPMLEESNKEHDEYVDVDGFESSLLFRQEAGLE